MGGDPYTSVKKKLSIPVKERYIKERGWLDKFLGALDYAGNISRSAMKGYIEGKSGWKHALQAADKERYTSPKKLRDTLIKKLGGKEFSFLDRADPTFWGRAWGHVGDFGMDLITTGGNHMSDGLGLSSSTELVYNENPGMTEAQVDQMMLDYLGNDYLVLDYIQSGGIHHIDCWAKFLGPSTVMVKDVSPSHSTYDDLNERAELLSQTMSAWGVPYDVVRVYCPSNTW